MHTKYSGFTVPARTRLRLEMEQISFWIYSTSNVGVVAFSVWVSHHHHPWPLHIQLWQTNRQLCSQYPKTRRTHTIQHPPPPPKKKCKTRKKMYIIYTVRCFTPALPVPFPNLTPLFWSFGSINAWWLALSRGTQSCERIPASVSLYKNIHLKIPAKSITDGFTVMQAHTHTYTRMHARTHTHTHTHTHAHTLHWWGRGRFDRSRPPYVFMAKYSGKWPKFQDRHKHFSPW